MTPENAPIVVAGAGWAGCAAATELALAGEKVVLVEAARIPGGRARAVELDGRRLDNGQHILLGAYSATLKLMQRMGLKESEAFLRLPLQMRYAPHTQAMQFAAPRFPAPLHMLWALLSARGLSRADKLSIARFHSAARWMGWLLYEDCSVSELLGRFDQSEGAVRMLWQPLCIAALNTPPERASAQVFLNVLKDSLGARRAASDMLIPRRDLSAVFPDQAMRIVREHGGEVQSGMRLTSLAYDQGTWQLGFANGQQMSARALILALPSWQTRSLLAELAPNLVPEFGHEAISTVYLQYSTALRLEHPFLALLDDPQEKQWGQFVFDRGQLDAAAAGLLAVVISTSGAAARLAHEELVGDVAQQLAQALHQPLFAKPLWSRVVTEKRATFACTPKLQRPANDTGLPGLWLAGDYTASPYPATLEAAVASGQAAALGLLAQSSSRTRARA